MCDADYLPMNIYLFLTKKDAAGKPLPKEAQAGLAGPVLPGQTSKHELPVAAPPPPQASGSASGSASVVSRPPLARPPLASKETELRLAKINALDVELYEFAERLFEIKKEACAHSRGGGRKIRTRKSRLIAA